MDMNLPDRTTLLAILDGFIAAKHRGDEIASMLARGARATENGAASPDEFWRHVMPTAYRLAFADATTGEAGCHATFNEGPLVGISSLRLRLDASGQIAEIESLVARKGDSNAFSPHRLTAPNPLFDRVEEVATRRSRAELIAIADAYFNAIEASNGEGAAISVNCDRIENGMRTTNNPAGGLPWDCREGMKIFGYIERVRDRRYPLIDEARGLVLSLAALEVPKDSVLSLEVEGKRLDRPQAERSIFLSELFKISDGRIEAIDVVVRNMPKGASFGWPV